MQNNTYYHMNLANDQKKSIETNYKRRNAEICGDSHRDGFVTSAESRLLLEQK